MKKLIIVLIIIFAGLSCRAQLQDLEDALKDSPTIKGMKFEISAVIDINRQLTEFVKISLSKIDSLEKRIVKLENKISKMDFRESEHTYDEVILTPLIPKKAKVIPAKD